jgi:single-stranded-DNA-specific exonuclease
MHPNYKYNFTKNSGAVVAWKLVYELKKSQEKTDVSWQDISGTDLVAISTICDMMYLEGENRAIVNLGLDALKQTKRTGLRALALLAGVQVDQVDTYHIGFLLGPRINAAGRLDHAMEAVRLLSTSDPKKAQDLALKLNDLNKERQQITEEVLQLAEEEVKKYPEIPNIIIIKGEDWPEGIIGLIAGKLLEKYHRPAIVLSENSEGKITGSARSLSPFNIIEAIEKSAKGLESYGGHALAAGVRLQNPAYEDFKNQMQEIASNLKPEDLQKQFNIDTEATVHDVTMEFLETLEKFKPFGFGNPKPTFLFKNLKFVDGRTMGQENAHMRGMFASEDGEVIKAVGFYKGELIEKLTKGQSIDIVGYAEINEYDSNREVQINIQDTNID